MDFGYDNLIDLECAYMWSCTVLYRHLHNFENAWSAYVHMRVSETPACGYASLFTNVRYDAWNRCAITEARHTRSNLLALDDAMHDLDRRNVALHAWTGESYGSLWVGLFIEERTIYLRLVHKLSQAR